MVFTSQGDDAVPRKCKPSKHASMSSIFSSKEMNTQAIQKRQMLRNSVATSTPFHSEKESWWHSVRGLMMPQDELSQEVERWKRILAAEARVTTSRTTKEKKAAGRRASHDPSSPDSDLFLIPDTTRPSYKTLDPQTRTMLAIACLLVAVLIANVFGTNPAGTAVLLIVQMITFYPVATCIAQECLCPPSRVTGAYLAQEGLLPSTFSKMDTLEIKEDEGICEIDVHYLHAESTGTSNGSPTEIDAIYCVHGFGVSSLVWLPVMRRLASDNGARHVLASDLVGWGLTSRPPVNNVGDLHRYGFSFAAGIALALLDRTLLASSNNPSPPNNRSIVLMGLSMGSIVTLRMALAMPGTTQIQIILVAPAVLSFYPLKHNELPRVLQVVIKMLSSLCGMIYVLCMPILLPIRWFVFDPLCYFLLKRVIAFKPFWRTGISFIWGDRSRRPISENDVERYRWPSIAKDCVEGVLHFLHAQPFRHGFMSYPGGDVQLFADVLERQNVQSISIIQGTNDPLIPAANARRLARLFPKIRVEEMEGLGHDPTGEAPDDFFKVVQKILSESSTTGPELPN